jgi:thioredoxin-like negative regulator of GroEL
MMGPLFESLSGEMRYATFLKVNVAEVPEAVQQFNIEAVPTFILFNGKEVERRTGMVSRPDFKSWIDKAIGAR